MDDIPEFLRRPKGWVPEPYEPPQQKIIETTQHQTIEAAPEPVDIRSRVEKGMRDNASKYITEINGFFDDWWLGQVSLFKGYEYFRTNEVKVRHVEIVIEYFKPQLEEITNRRECPQLKEAYSRYTGAEIRGMKEFLTDVIEGAQRWIANQNVAKGPRKKRVVTIKPDKMVAKLKYQREAADLQLISIPPEKVIGAQELWTYNTKYKQLTRYVARTRSGLKVKGTTLQDFDVDNSVTKVLRKPGEVLKEVLTTKKKSILDKLSTKAIEPTGRINEQTILLKVT